MTKELRRLADELCESRLVFALEGGYDLNALPACLGSVVLAMVDQQAGAKSPFSVPPRWLGQSLRESRMAIQNTRLAHRDLPMRLLEGYAAVMVPFGVPRSGPVRNVSPSTNVAVGISTVAQTPPTSGKRPVTTLAPPTKRRRRYPRKGPPPSPEKNSPAKHGGLGGSPHEEANTVVLCFSVQARQQISGEQTDKLQSMGAHFADEWHTGVTHVVANQLRRTERLMCAVCRGQKLVTVQWILASLRLQRWADERGYPLRDESMEASLGVTLPSALSRALVSPLLARRKVYIGNGVTGLARDAAKRVVSAAGGDLLASAPNETDDVIVIGTLCVDAKLNQNAVPCVCPQYSVELIFEGALTQELRWDRHRL